MALHRALGAARSCCLLTLPPSLEFGLGGAPPVLELLSGRTLRLLTLENQILLSSETPPKGLSHALPSQ